jgi:hypothetical protein
LTRRSFEPLVFFLQVEKPMEFLTNCEGNKDEVKRLIGTLLWNFSRRQPPRSDSEWMVLWRDLCTLQEKAFPFLEKEYLLEELCRGLLQAGKYSLAKNYLAGTGSMSLPPEKAEAVVLETAREFLLCSVLRFFSSKYHIFDLIFWKNWISLSSIGSRPLHLRSSGIPFDNFGAVLCTNSQGTLRDLRRG